VSSRQFKNAIVRTPAPNFGDGITSAGLGHPDYKTTLEQHEQYCLALEFCGLKVTALPPDPQFPDSTFVEDTAVLTPEVAIITRPGAETRRGEIDGIREALGEFYTAFKTIEPPGTLDGGDVLQTGREFFIGISARTNEEGARQLAHFLAEAGYQSTALDIRAIYGLLHLKSGISSLHGHNLVMVDSLACQSEFDEYRRIRVRPDEEYAANCVWVNGNVLLAEGFYRLHSNLCSFCPVVVDVSEFRKMDGGLSCLSLRF
jgi:dimethylargininase